MKVNICFTKIFFGGRGGGGMGVDGRTDEQAKPICPLNFFEVGVITMHKYIVMALTNSIYDHSIISPASVTLTFI